MAAAADGEAKAEIFADPGFPAAVAAGFTNTFGACRALPPVGAGCLTQTAV